MDTHHWAEKRVIALHYVFGATLQSQFNVFSTSPCKGSRQHSFLSLRQKRLLVSEKIVCSGWNAELSSIIHDCPSFSQGNFQWFHTVISKQVDFRTIWFAHIFHFPFEPKKWMLQIRKSRIYQVSLPLKWLKYSWMAKEQCQKRFTCQWIKNCTNGGYCFWE